MQRDAEAELIGARVERLAAELFGRHVRQRSDERAGRGHASSGRRRASTALPTSGRSTRLLREPREPEVHDAHGAVAPDHDVLGLEVAVDDAGRVRRRQPAPGRDEHVAGSRASFAAARASHSSRVSPSTNSIAMYTRSSTVPASWTVTTFGCDRRAMARASRSRRARRAARRRAGFVDDLQRDPPIQIRVVGGVDLAHAAPPDGGQDLIAVDARAGRKPSDVGPTFVARGGDFRARGPPPPRSAGPCSSSMTRDGSRPQTAPAPPDPPQEREDGCLVKARAPPHARTLRRFVGPDHRRDARRCAATKRFRRRGDRGRMPDA